MDSWISCYFLFGLPGPEPPNFLFDLAFAFWILLLLLYFISSSCSIYSSSSSNSWLISFFLVSFFIDLSSSLPLSSPAYCTSFLRLFYSKSSQSTLPSSFSRLNGFCLMRYLRNSLLFNYEHSNLLSLG